jgi:cyclophilin family peptidyl-prolyl cis-trans isomerase
MNTRSRWSVVFGAWVALLQVLAAAEPRVAPERIVFQTVAGDIVLALWPDVAPRHAAQLLRLARLGAFDTTHFLRIDPSGHYVQLADAADRLVPLSPSQRDALRPIPAEFGAQRHVRGVVSMAREPADPHSARSSFVILLKDSPHLDPPNPTYTIVGEVERGLDVVERLGSLRSPTSEAPVVRLTVWQALVAGPEELGRFYLRGPQTVAAAAAARTDAESPRAAAIGFGVLFATGTAAFWFARRARAGRATTSLILLGVLVAAFMVLVLLVPVASQRTWLGLGLIALGLAAIKLMTFFDAADR